RDSVSLLDQARHSSSSKITDVEVAELLGLPPLKAMHELTNTVVQGGTTSDLVKSLHALYDQGFDPSTLAREISSALRQKLIDGELKDKDATLNLLEALLLTPVSSDTRTYLEIVLLKYLPTSLKPQ